MIRKLVLTLVILALVAGSRAYVFALWGDRDVERCDGARALGCHHCRALTARSCRDELALATSPT